MTCQASKSGPLVLLLVVVASGWVGTAHAKKPAKEKEVAPFVTWRVFYGYNLETARASAKLQKLNEKRVEVRGFMVPLQEDARAVYEFLIVPTQQACEHVSPPPLNQLVHAKAPKGVPYLWGPIIAVGKLEVVQGAAIKREAPFQLEVELAEKYRPRPHVPTLK